MIFSSPQFILLFLPAAFFGYFYLNRQRLVVAGKVWLVALSLLFYAVWNVAYLPLLLASIVFNFVLGSRLAVSRADAGRQRWWLLAAGISANLLLLGYFKYAGFLVGNLNGLFQLQLGLPQILLPLGISFFTFTQVAFLVDSYRGAAKEYELLNYSLFVTFFPHLIAGPILHHSEMMPQFSSRWTLAVRWRNVLAGLFIFSLGMFKKVVIADSFAVWANAGFDGGQALDFYSAWCTSLSYTFQLYFDFSGYCDMAIGASLLFNIWLPINFNSPYKACDIQDFWRRWHMTLSRYLRDYLYIPLGGNRSSPLRMHFNLLATFILGGLWHGASWMFVIWGALHGLAVVLHRVWQGLQWRLPTALAWLLTFGFVNFTWVFFRASTPDDALRVLRGMADLASAWQLPVAAVSTAKLAPLGWLADDLLRYLPTGLVANLPSLGAIVLAFGIISRNNSFELMSVRLGGARLAGAGLLLCIAMYATVLSQSSVFLYFNF
ncbi:MAG: MBOAT family protein [Rhodoferax sp.]|nr:MBOAT family protein [Rhodoferax sp.]